MCKSQAMSRSINLWYYLHAHFHAKLLQVTKFALCIAAITGSQSGVGITLQAESCIGLVPIVLVIFWETVVVKMHLQAVHLVVAHYSDQLA